jgi:hypothetical protein
MESPSKNGSEHAIENVVCRVRGAKKNMPPMPVTRSMPPPVVELLVVAEGAPASDADGSWCNNRTNESAHLWAEGVLRSSGPCHTGERAGSVWTTRRRGERG